MSLMWVILLGSTGDAHIWVTEFNAFRATVSDASSCTRAVNACFQLRTPRAATRGLTVRVEGAGREGRRTVASGAANDVAVDALVQQEAGEQVRVLPGGPAADLQELLACRPQRHVLRPRPPHGNQGHKVAQHDALDSRRVLHVQQPPYSQHIPWIL